MPLTPVSPNIQRSGNLDPRPHSQPQDVAFARSSQSVASSGIQSMLRTGTEIGDIGQFSMRPPRLPRSGSRIQATRRRSGSFDASFRSTLRYQKSPRHYETARRHDLVETPSAGGLRRQGTTRSNTTSYRQNLHVRARAVRRYPPAFEGLASPPNGPRAMHQHPSPMLTQGRLDVQSMQPNPSHVYAPRRRGPGPRAYSPAVAENEFYRRTPRLPHPRAGSVGTATSSPASMLRWHHPGPGYRAEGGQSFSSLVRLPSPAVHSAYFGPARSPYPMRTSTPGSFHLRDLRAESTASAASINGVRRSPTGSSTPRYYDYSESFIEERCFSPGPPSSAASLSLNISPAGLEHEPRPASRQAQSPFGTMPGSHFHPVELPTSHDRQVSEQSKHSQAGAIPGRTSSVLDSVLPKLQRHRNPGVCPHSTSKSDVPRNEEAKEARVAAASRRISPSSPSTFFPNVSRSPRDLTTLAARVHSPTPDAKSSRPVPLRSMPSLVAVPKTTTEGHARPSATSSSQWQLPSLHFRPLSFTSIDGSADRPKTSGVDHQKKSLEILSPTPERPMSSQSRKRFSKILDVDDITAGADSPRGPSGKASHSTRAPKLRVVEEVTELSYPARFSIPPFSPRTTALGGTEKPDADADTGTSLGERSIHSVSHDHSTVESLLEKHIECLGLSPDVYEVSDPGYRASAESELDSTARHTNSTIKPRSLRDLGLRSIRSRSDVAGYANTPESEIVRFSELMPKPLFGSRIGPPRKLSTTQSFPSFPRGSSVLVSSEGLSSGWQTLTSTSQFASEPALERVVSSEPENDWPPPVGEAARYRLKHQSRLSISLSLSGHFAQISRDEAGFVRTQVHRDLDREASRRRRMRIRLKLKRNSRILGNTEIQEQAEPEGIRLPAQTRLSIEEPTELDSRPVSPRDVQSVRNVPRDQVPGLSPPIPNRWSSINPSGSEYVKQRVELARGLSVKTGGSVRSNHSLAEPINNTPRLSTQGRRLAPTPTSDLDLSIPYAEVPSTIRPTLRETRSFFSDNSSTLHKTHGSFRQKFRLHSLRSVLPSSPRTTSGPDHAGDDVGAGDAQTKLRHSCQVRGRKSTDHEPRPNGTVGMSDFAYRRRKVLDRMKDWWNRQCVQKRLAIMRKKRDRP